MLIKRAFQLAYKSRDLFGIHSRTIFALAPNADAACDMLRESLGQMQLPVVVVEEVSIITPNNA